MTPSVALRLGRVSNLPTVWTNVLAGLTLAGASAGDAMGRTALLVVAASLFYVGGMYLNDAFDREIDARERPERPIPSGQVAASTVFGVGFALLAAGEGLVALLGRDGAGFRPALAGLALAGAIVLYDAYHKANPLSPLLMGLCRVLVYAVAALSVAGQLPSAVWVGAVVLLCYLIGLTYTAKQENLRQVSNLWPLAFLAAPFAYVPALGHTAGVVLYVALGLWLVFTLRLITGRGPRDIPRAVGQLIAGISLVDGLLVAAHGSGALALACAAGLVLTLAFQRFVPGT